MVSPKAASCPQCGHLLPNSFRRRYNRVATGCVLVLFALLLGLAALVYSFSAQH
jgi:uncharacterized paraquat-inducible protein A